ncbi:hypothetical protein [Prolixibacter bellariivorans]|nr:hypothetical protein [Prolixibacter bellariivorans]
MKCWQLLIAVGPITERCMLELQLKLNYQVVFYLKEWNLREPIITLATRK